MKNSSTLIIALVLSFQTFSQDQTLPEPSSTVVKIHPQQFVDNTFYLSLEKFNKEFKNSINVGLGLTASNGDINQSGYKAEVQYRYFPLKFSERKNRRNNSTYHGGIFTGVYVHNSYNVRKSQYFSYDETSPEPTLVESKEKVLAFNPGVVIGYQKTFFEKLYLEVFVGGGIRTAITSGASPEYFFDNGDVFGEKYEGVFPKIGFSIGIGL